ncbi:tetratricopeptide repeat-containing sulfotransferase family protein [Idiomarina abyssalis]|uniref:tetratricopeptide repeat-containing sulfotransferase family protein n=1 Tax=Idiomarina abyssalis TaxID=86102 RepID=UPI0006C889F3|nr:tetratricopeptide repeat-containing sulfotransferase family protein [Idiomarina abyssalis]SFT88993.1 Tetratricopeptide repeat-containing protein [Idiomarina abyssalis]
MDHIKKLLAQSQFEQALKLLQQERDGLSGDAEKESLYYEAVAYRYLGQLQQAQQTLHALLAKWPEYGRALQELAHTLKAQGKDEEALSHYYQAIRLNPALHASWAAAAKLEAKSGNTEQAERNQQQANFLLRQPKQILAALNLYHEGKYYKAEKICRAFLQRNPHHVEAMRTLANIGAQLDVLNDAEFLLESVLVLEPNYDLAKFDYIKVLQRRQKHSEAYKHAKELFEKEPGNPLYKALFANLSAALDYDEQALTLYDELINEQMNDDIAGIHVAKGHLLKAIGQQQDAIQSYQSACQERPDFGDAYWSLANLKTYKFSDSEIAVMERAAQDSRTHLNDRIHFCFALGKAFEQHGEHNKSFDYYQQGNELKRGTSHFKPEVLAQRIAAQREYFTEQKVKALPEASVNSNVTPIFIVGLPRAGSTLVEQILASHSAVEGTSELPNIPAIAHSLNGRQVQADTPKYPSVLDELTPEKLMQLGERYLAETEIYRSGALFFTDKMPNNFRHIGLIKTLLPHAKIIDARRNPMDCCFSAYKQLFAEGQEFSYGLDMLAEYYRDYVDLMAHWNKVYPGSIHTVIHEQLVENPEAEIKAMFDYLELPLEPQCLQSHKAERRVKTASSEQVRQPINAKGIGQWQKFEAQLQPLQEALGQSLMEQWDRR